MNLYDQTWVKLMAPPGYADRGHLTTWTLSFNHLRAQSKAAANLLLLWAFLDNQDLWYGLLAPALNRGIVDELPDWFAQCAGNELEFKECMGLLLKYSFADAKTESSSFSTHSVFHGWCFHAFEADRAVMSRLAVIIVASAVPSETTPHYTLTQRRLLPHCDRVFSFAQQDTQERMSDEMNLRRRSDSYHQLGNLYSDQGRMREAEVMYVRALKGYEKAWGAEYNFTLDIANHLGALYWKQRRMAADEMTYLRALKRKEKAWGAEHPSTLDTANVLGALYWKQGRMEEAEHMYMRALTRYEKTWGPEHTSTLNIVNNLRNLYKNQDKMKEAEDMYLRALTEYEKI